MSGGGKRCDFSKAECEAAAAVASGYETVQPATQLGLLDESSRLWARTVDERG